MQKWTYEKELAECTEILLNAYLNTMHSAVITAIFFYNDDVYSYDLTESDINELTTVTAESLQMNALGKKRIEKIVNKSTKFATVNDFEQLKEIFPSYRRNNGYIAEFLFRIKVNNESVEEIKHSNNSKSYAKASDTKDNRQLKNLNGKASYTELKHLLEVCEKVNYKDTEKVRNSIEMLKKIYNK